MKKNNTIDRLRTLNALFARTGESAPESAEHIRHVLDFFGKEQEENAAGLPFLESADRLAQLHFGSGQERKLLFAHWNVPADEQFGPLWIRQSLIVRMKQITGCRSAFLLITGLREAVCPAGSYWTRKRQEYYISMCNYINELACSWATPGSRLQLALF